jgi:hypothetical protein
MKKLSDALNQKTKDFILRSFAILGHPKVWLRKKTKVFVIGTHKTGTTSLMLFLSDLGFRLGLERQFAHANGGLSCRELGRNIPRNKELRSVSR